MYSVSDNHIVWNMLQIGSWPVFPFGVVFVEWYFRLQSDIQSWVLVKCTCNTEHLQGKDFSFWSLTGAVMSQTSRSREIDLCAGFTAEAPWDLSDRWSDPSHFSGYASTALFRLFNRKNLANAAKEEEKE